jgi:hypothetical protein
MWVESLILLNQYTDESQPSGAQWLLCDFTPLNKSFLNGLMIQDWINLLNMNRRMLEQCRSRLSVHPYRRMHLKISLSHQIKIHGSQ